MPNSSNPNPRPVEVLRVLQDRRKVALLLADTDFPELGDADLPRFAVVALDQIKRRVQFAVGTAAVGLAAFAAADRQGSAKQPVMVDQLGEPGAEVALGWG